MNMLRRWIRDKKGGRHGLVMASVINGRVCVGWSLWNKRLDKRCDWSKCEEVCKGRMDRDFIKPFSPNEIATEAVGAFVELAVAANRYFKDCTPRSVSEFLFHNSNSGIDRWYGIVNDRQGNIVTVDVGSNGVTEYCVGLESTYKLFRGDYVRVKKTPHSTRVDRIAGERR